MHAWSTVCTPHTFLLKRCGTWSQFAHRSSPSVHKAAMAKSNMIIVVAMCLFLGLSLQGCASCDTEAAAAEQAAIAQGALNVAAEEAFAARDAEKVKAASAAVMAKAAEENRLADVASKAAGKLTAVAPAPAAASGDLVIGLFDAELSDDSDSD